MRCQSQFGEVEDGLHYASTGFSLRRPLFMSCFPKVNVEFLQATYVLGTLTNDLFSRKVVTVGMRMGK